MMRSPGEPDRPCLWMSAGLISYKLCDRAFDCEHCPLDAALRGEAPDDAGLAPATPLSGAVVFPGDRAYAPGHLWARRQPGGGPIRIGLDALAAALLGAPGRARLCAGETVAAGEQLCELEVAGGAVSIASPLACRSPRLNPALLETPALAALDPYGSGWIVEADVPAGEPLGLLEAAPARRGTGLDLRHLRRRIALELLSAPEVGTTLADGGTPLTDLRRMIGPQRFLALVRELVH
jgi:glycine cleavage system H lipoate-binding protein